MLQDIGPRLPSTALRSERVALVTVEPSPAVLKSLDLNVLEGVDGLSLKLVLPDPELR